MVKVTIFTRLTYEYVVDYLGELYIISAQDIFFFEGSWWTYKNKLIQRY